MVCYKRLLYIVGFLRPPATTSGWTTFPTGYHNSEIQEFKMASKMAAILLNLIYIVPVCQTDFILYIFIEYARSSINVHKIQKYKNTSKIKTTN